MDREATSSVVPFLLAAGPLWLPQSYREGLRLTLRAGRRVRGTTMSSPVLMQRRRQGSASAEACRWGKDLELPMLAPRRTSSVRRPYSEALRVEPREELVRLYRDDLQAPFHEPIIR